VVLPRERALMALPAAAAAAVAVVLQVLSSEEQECPPLPGGIAVAPSAVPSVGPGGISGVTALVQPAAGSDSSLPGGTSSKAAAAGQRQQQQQHGQHQVYVAQQEQPASVQQVAIGMPPMPHLG
jgi:hypothetical protein